MRKSFSSAGLAALLLATSVVAVVAPTVRADTGLDKDRQVVLVAQNEELDVYDPVAGGLWAEPLVKQSDWVNGTPCFIPGDPDHRFLEADDNPNENGFNGEEHPFFGVFKNDGTRDMSGPISGRVGADAAMKDPAGCTFDDDGNFFGVDVGENHTPLQGDGKVIEFFAATGYRTWCVVDPTLSQAGNPAFHDGRLYVPETGGGAIWTYTPPTLPTDTCYGGKTPFATAATMGVGTPISLVRLPDDGGWAVSSVLAPSGVFKVSDQGVNLGPLAAPGPDTGTPFGIGFIGNDLYYADLGVQPLPDPTDPSTPADSVDGHAGLRWAKAGIPVARPLVTGWNFADGVAIVKASDISDKISQTLVTCDWATFGHDLGRSFAAPGACSSIDAGNVQTLQQKWHFDTGAPVTAQPVVKDVVLYVGSSSGRFYALDANTGVEKWHFDVEDPNHADYGLITASAAVADVGGTRVVVFAGAASLYVLDAESGTQIAAACVDPQHPSDTGACDPKTPNSTGSTVEIESSPAVLPHGSDDAWIYVGMDYNEATEMGPAGLLKFELKKTGSATNSFVFDVKWKYDPETEQTYTTAPLGPHEQENPHPLGCGNVWSSPVVDSAHGLVVFGVGNCDAGTTPDDNPNARTPTQESISAVDYDTGAKKFVYKPTRDFSNGDPDVDFGATPNLLLDNQVGEGGKDGHYYSLSTVDPLGTKKWEAHAAMPSDLGGMIGSTAVGMSKGRPAVFAGSALPFSTRDPMSSLTEGMNNFSDGLQNGTVRVPPGGLHAFRAPGSVDENNPNPPDDGGTAIWDAAALPAYGAVVYVGNLVFLPDTFGFSMQAYNADTGALVWTMPTVGPPASPPSFLGDTMYFGSGIPEADSPLSNIGGIWAYSLASTG